MLSPLAVVVIIVQIVWRSAHFCFNNNFFFSLVQMLLIFPFRPMFFYRTFHVYSFILFVVRFFLPWLFRVDNQLTIGYFCEKDRSMGKKPYKSRKKTSEKETGWKSLPAWLWLFIVAVAFQINKSVMYLWTVEFNKKINTRNTHTEMHGSKLQGAQQTNHIEVKLRRKISSSV